MSGACFDHWSAGTIEGHADELVLLQRHAPGCTIAEAALSDGVPCVVGLDAGRLVVVRLGVAPVFGSGHIEVMVQGPSATILQGEAVATRVSVPSALAMEVIANDWRNVE